MTGLLINTSIVVGVLGGGAAVREISRFGRLGSAVPCFGPLELPLSVALTCPDQSKVQDIIDLSPAKKLV